LINSDPYGEGWLFDVEVESPALGDQMNKLMSASDYQRLVVG
jgi:glycine cleavage system H lipoate-binding protein